MLLKGFTRDVQREIIRIHHTFDKTQILRHHLLEVICDEYSPHIQLDVVRFFAVVIEHGRWSSLGDKQDGTECHLTFSNEVDLRKWIIAILEIQEHISVLLLLYGSGVLDSSSSNGRIYCVKVVACMNVWFYTWQFFIFLATAASVVLQLHKNVVLH